MTTETETKSPEQAMGEVYDAMHAEPAPAVETPPADAAPSPEASQSRARDEAGRFTKSDKAPDAIKSEAIGKTPEPEAKPATAAKAPEGPGKGAGAELPAAPPPEPVPSVKAPQAWTAAAREAFAKAPPEVQREVDRREREITRALSETAQARQFAVEVQRSLQPYESIARSNGTDAMTWAGNALQMVASLYAGTPQQRAQTIAQAIKLSGADLDTINGFLSGQSVAQTSSMPPVDVRGEVERYWQQMEQRREMETNQRAAEEFLANPPEFWNEVSADVLELIRLDRAKGGNMSPQQAYDRAIRFNEDAQKVISQRKAAEDAKKRQAEMAASKAAASSVRTQPVGPASPAKKTDRQAMEEMYDQIASGGR